MFDEAVPPEVVRHFCNVAADRLGVSIGITHHDLVAGRVAKRLHTLLDAIFCSEGLAPLVASARQRALAAIGTLVAEQGLLCTGLSDEPLATSGGEADAGLEPSSVERRPPRQGHC